MGPEVGRMQAREKTRVVTACDKCYGEIHGSDRMRSNQKRGGASNVRATQRDADGGKHALGSKCRYQGRMRKHKLRATHSKMWLIKPLQRRLRIMR